MTTKCLTSSFGGRFDFGIGIKSLVQLSGRKWEEGCSENSFFLKSLESLMIGLELFTDVDFLVVVVAVDLVVGSGVVDDDDGNDETVVVVVSSN